MVGFKGPERFVGEEALSQYARNTANTVTALPALLGATEPPPGASFSMAGGAVTVDYALGEDAGPASVEPELLLAMLLRKLAQESAVSRTISDNFGADVAQPICCYWASRQGWRRGMPRAHATLFGRKLRCNGTTTTTTTFYIHIECCMALCMAVGLRTVGNIRRRRHPTSRPRRAPRRTASGAVGASTHAHAHAHGLDETRGGGAEALAQM